MNPHTHFQNQKPNKNPNCSSVRSNQEIKTEQTKLKPNKDQLQEENIQMYVEKTED